MKLDVYNYNVDLTDDEIKRKYVEWLNMGVTYANPPDYNSSRDNHNKQYIRIDYEFDKDYYMDVYKPKKK